MGRPFQALPSQRKSPELRQLEAAKAEAERKRLLDRKLRGICPSSWDNFKVVLDMNVCGLC